MILKNGETEAEFLVKNQMAGYETRLKMKVLPDQVEIAIGRFGRIQKREVVSIPLPYDDGLALYQMLHKKFGGTR